MAPPFRADHVGSLIRPESLLQSRKQSGVYSRTEQDRDATREAIAHAVGRQIDLSIRPITSGEFERTGFFEGFFEKLGGMDVREYRIPSDFRGGFPTTEFMGARGLTHFAAVVASGPIRHVESAYLSSWELLKSQTPRELWSQCKMTMPSVTWQHMQLPEGQAYDEGVYASGRAYLSDLAAAFRTELGILYDAGLRHVQVDDPNLTYFVSETFRARMRADGVDPDALLDLYIWAHNAAIRDLSSDLHVGVHLCRGNIPDTDGFVSGSYDGIAERVLTGLDYHSFYLEFDDDRSGDFECLRHLPPGKNVVLGLISTKRVELEDAEVLKGRIREAAGVIAHARGVTVEQALECLAVSPQCGFASFEGNRGVGGEQRMWDKLTLARDVARQMWTDA